MFPQVFFFGGKFEVYTDNNLLTYILTSAKLDATGQGWVASLANNNFTIHYQSGKQNVEAELSQESNGNMMMQSHFAKGFECQYNDTSTI